MRCLILLMLLLLAGPSPAQFEPDSTLVRPVQPMERVVRVERSKAGEYAQAGFGLGGVGGALGWFVWNSAQGRENPFSAVATNHKAAIRGAAKWSAACAAVGTIIGAIVGSGEREVYELPVTLIPTRGGALVLLTRSR